MEHPNHNEIKRLLALAWEIYNELEKHQKYIEYSHFGDELCMIEERLRKE